MGHNDSEFIDYILNQYEAEQSCLLQKDPTVFEILGRTYDEDLISRMLAYTLKKDANLVRNILSHCSKIEIPSCRIIDIECEKSMCGGRASRPSALARTASIFSLRINKKRIEIKNACRTASIFHCK